MLDKTQTREEWSTSFCSLVASELQQGTHRGLLTSAEAHQLTTRFLILLEQALDLPSLRPGTATPKPWQWAAS
ncbi:MAG: hypothetical protein QOG96_385 [Pseudonocardiales bacterium]|nr:hypothetical protein [Pseudonocardiales bacterium]